MKKLYRIPGILGVRDLIKAVSEAHLGVTEFKSGTNLSDTTDNSYPLAFLESDFSSETVGPKETFIVMLSVADRMPEDASEDDYLKGISKIDQILSEIHYELSQISSIVTVGDSLRKLRYRDLEEDRLVVVRCEFEITIVRQTAKKDTPVDRVKLQEFLDTLPTQ